MTADTGKPGGAMPITVWDPNDRRNVYCRHRREAAAWARKNLPRSGDTVLAEFYLIDAPFAVLRRIRRDEDGKIGVARDTGGITLEPPATVMLGELPPVHLR
jgi:hypothetical protein